MSEINLWWDEDEDGGQWFVAMFIDGKWDANDDVPVEIQDESDAIEWVQKSWPEAHVRVVGNTGF